MKKGFTRQLTICNARYLKDIYPHMGLIYPHIPSKLPNSNICCQKVGTGTKCRAYKHPRPPSKQTQKRHIVSGQYMSWDKMSRDKMSPDRIKTSDLVEDGFPNSLLEKFPTIQFCSSALTLRRGVPCIPESKKNIPVVPSASKLWNPQCGLCTMYTLYLH